MGHLDHAAYGRLTPALSHAMASVGAALGLRCTVRALAATGAARRNRLLTAASALGTGIWTMHFVAMLGSHVTGTEIRHDVPLMTLLGLVAAVVVVGARVFAVGYGQGRGSALAVGGLTTGLGVAGMHYPGMAALRLHGSVSHDAATAALWAALHTRTPAAVATASLAMGAAVSSMHNTGMAAVAVRVVPSDRALPGATAMRFVFPLAVGLGSYLFLTAAFVALSPTAAGPAGAPSAPAATPAAAAR
ncbi:MHYT domain-containing protein [Streptomyces globosus]|uniref:MHYT domain-containing protein n=1 Tax=Streptomyces globosus TaxID=68209 RepID=UPI003822D3B4